MARPPKTLAEFAAIGLLNSGDKRYSGRLAEPRALIDAAKVCGTIWALAFAASKTGDWSQAAYAEYWKISERNAQREWALCRRAFPQHHSPEPLARWLLAEVASRLDSSAAALSATPPADLALAA